MSKAGSAPRTTLLVSVCLFREPLEHSYLVYLATGAFFASLSILMAIVEFCPYSPLHKFIEYCSERLKNE